jgi:hypothetical protein
MRLVMESREDKPDDEDKKGGSPGYPFVAGPEQGTAVLTGRNT